MSNKQTKAGYAPVKLSEAGEELVKKLVVLYNSQTFVREGKELREKLLSSGLEAGSYLASVSMLAERRAKLDAVNKAVVLLNRVVYTANAMLMLGLYALKDVEPVLSYCSGVLSALKDLLRKVPETRRVIRVKSPVNVVNSVPVGGDEEEQYTPEYLQEPSGFEDFEGNTEGFDDPV